MTSDDDDITTAIACAAEAIAAIARELAEMETRVQGRADELTLLRLRIVDIANRRLRHAAERKLLSDDDVPARLH